MSVMLVVKDGCKNGGCILFFFFKQKTAYEMLRSLVGSEMCIRDSPLPHEILTRAQALAQDDE